jgi:L-ascorbate metabolism protein UlaG (beta-lactamase superfamily)
MDIQFYGANCITLTSKQTRLVVDDTLAELGGKSITKDGDISLFTGAHQPVAAKVKISIDTPGEYEVSNISILGLQVRAHMDEANQQSGVIYKITWGDTKVLVAGHVYPKLTDTDLEAIGLIDIMFVPVGGNGYTMDGTGALQLIKQIEPKVVLPTHYADKALNYEVPQQTLEEALKGMSMEPKETVKKLQLKQLELTDSTQLVVLEKS